MKDLKPVAIVAVLFVVVQLAALAFMSFALGPENQVFEDPGDPKIAGYYVLLLLGFTALFLLLIKFGLERFIRAIFFVSIGLVIFFVAVASADVFIDHEGVILLLGVLLGTISILAIWRNPEWYVIDSVGIVMSIGIVALLGISLSMLPVILLLLALAIYDAISVYKTKHMLTLAEGVIDMGLPLLLVVPKKLPYSFKESKPRIMIEKGAKREAFFVGLGDIIIPGLLPASAFWFVNDEKIVFGLSANLLVALVTILGALIGLLLLMKLVSRGDPHAGLPFLNIGAIGGYFISYIAIFGVADLSLVI